MYHLGNLKVAYINHSNDTRGEDFSSHNPYISESTLPENISCYKASTLLPLDLELANQYDVIGVDEAQFFPDLIEFAEMMVRDHRKIILIAGLSGDSDRKKFGKIIDLIPQADDVVFLHALCRSCMKGQRVRDAPFSKCTTNKSNQVMVGGNDTYEAACRQCHAK